MLNLAVEAIAPSPPPIHLHRAVALYKTELYKTTSCSLHYPVRRCLKDIRLGLASNLVKMIRPTYTRSIKEPTPSTTASVGLKMMKALICVCTWTIITSICVRMCQFQAKTEGPLFADTCQSTSYLLGEPPSPMAALMPEMEWRRRL